MKRNNVGLLALALIVTLVASACAGTQTGAQTGQNNTPAATTAAGNTGGTGGQAAPGTITAMLGDVIREADQAAIDYCTQQTGVKVQVLTGPQSATDRLAQYLQFFGAQSGDIDVMQIDVIWPGILAEHLVDLKPYIPADQLAAHFQRIVENNTVNGALVGLPWFTDAGLLYYRTDLMEKYGYKGAPATWAELAERANKIQAGERGEGKSDFWGFVWQGAAYEGLTCDALEWQASWGGGQIVEPDKKISINNAQAAAAFDMAAGWVGKISPQGVTSYKEEEARNVWQAGNAAFMRNWPYAFSLGNEQGSAIAGKYAVAPLPKGDGANARNADTLGGWQMAVSKYSEDVDSAAKFAVCMTSREAQKIRAVQGSYLPTIGDLYKDKDVLAANPFFGQLFDVFSGGAVARPSTVTAEQYNEVSTIYFTEVNRVLTGQQTGQQAVEAIEQQLKSLLQ